LPNALVTGSPERVPDIAIALKSAGFDILSAAPISPEDAPEHEAGSVDCYVVVLVSDEIATTAGVRPSEPQPWWHYADVEPDLAFADWRQSILAMASPR
jgi:hypothetical protein